MMQYRRRWLVGCGQGVGPRQRQGGPHPRDVSRQPLPFRGCCRKDLRLTSTRAGAPRRYRFFPSPLRFTERAWGQVNWHYDTGHNVPADLCPPGEGCEIAYSVMSYWYLAQPRDASAEMRELPWPYPSAAE